MRSFRGAHEGKFAIDTSIVIAIVVAAGGIITGISGVVLGWRRAGGEENQTALENYRSSFRELIETAEKRGDEKKANQYRQDYETHLNEWQSQEGLRKIAPRELSGIEEDRRTVPQEAAQLKQLLDQSQDLSPAVLSANDYFLRGNAYHAIENFAEALASYNRALNLHPNDADTLVNRGATLHGLERYDEALADFDRAFALRPDHAGTIYNRGLTLHHLERYEDSLADYDRALALRPDHAATLMNRAVTLRYLKRYDEALAGYKRALELQPDDGEIYMNRGLTFGHLKRYDEALAVFDRALSLRANHAGTLINRGITLHHLGRPSDALDSYGRAIEQEPHHVLYLLNRASLLAEMKDVAGATEDLRRALSSPDLAGFRWERATEAASHPYFQPLRADPSLRKLFKSIVAAPA